MGLAISLKAGETFNVGIERFRVEAIGAESGCRIRRLGGPEFELGPEGAVAIAKDVSAREGPKPQTGSVRLDIEAPQNFRIWRGLWEAKDVSVGLLAPVPLEHLQSGQEVCEREGRVAFGSNAWQVFEQLDGSLQKTGCDALICASHSEAFGAPTVTWAATYLRTVRSRGGAHPDGMKLRPPTTVQYASDNTGHWAVFWEVTDLRPLAKEDRIKVSTLRSHGSKKAFVSGFRPEGPILIEF